MSTTAVDDDATTNYVPTLVVLTSLFPTIFTLASAELGRRSGEGSGALCMAIVGGAIVPVLQGFFADRVGVLPAFFIPAICYAFIAYYGLSGHRIAGRT